MKRRNSIPESAFSDVAGLYLKGGLNTHQIAERYGVATSTVCAFLKHHGVPLRGEGRTRKVLATRDELFDLYVTKGMTTPELADFFGVTDACTVRKWLLKYGIPRRKLGPRKLTTCCESGCKKPVYRIRHSGNGAWYGRRCKYHRTLHYAKLNRYLVRKHKSIPAHRWRWENEIPEEVKQSEQFKQRKEKECLTQAKNTMTEINLLLRNPGLLRSRRRESGLDKTSQG